FDPQPPQQIDQVFRGYVAGRLRREWAATRASHGGVERHDAALQRRHRIRIAGVARVVEVRPHARAEIARTGTGAPDLRRGPHANGVGEADLVRRDRQQTFDVDEE